MTVLLITGSSGTLGQNYLEKLYETDDDTILILPFSKTHPKTISSSGKRNVVWTICDLSDKHSVKCLFFNYKIDKIIHLAAKSSPRTDLPQEIIDSNIKGTLNLLEYCQPNTDFVFTSSILVYGGGPSSFQENDKCNPTSVYGVSKLACENLLNIYYKNGKIRPRILRICGLVGKGMHHGRIAEALSGKEKFTLYGQKPGAEMPYLSVRKCCEALQLAVESNRASLICNICPKDTLSLETIFQTIEDKMKRKIELTWVESNVSNDIIHCHTESADYLLGWKSPESSLQELQSGLDEIL